MSKDETVYLRHVLDSIEKIESYVQGVSKEDFSKTSIVHDAVIRQLEIIGEAAKQLSERIRKMQPSIPWASIAGMRDKLIHNYFGVDLEIVWLTVVDNLPPLKSAVEAILRSIE